MRCVSSTLCVHTGGTHKMQAQRAESSEAFHTWISFHSLSIKGINLLEHTQPQAAQVACDGSFL